MSSASTKQCSCFYKYNVVQNGCIKRVVRPCTSKAIVCLYVEINPRYLCYIHYQDWYKQWKITSEYKKNMAKITPSSPSLPPRSSKTSHEFQEEDLYA